MKRTFSTPAGKKAKRAVALCAVALAIFSLTGCSSKSLSCFDAKARSAVSAVYVQRFASVLKNDDLAGVIWNVHTTGVNSETGERMCSGQLIVYEKATRRVAFKGRADYLTRWDPRTGSFDAVPFNMPQIPQAAPADSSEAAK